MSKPIFVVFEGLDGTGKSTAARLVARRLGAIYMTTPCEALRKTRDEILRALGDSQEARQLFYQATVFAAAHQARMHLAAGQTVVLDRYFLSTEAYAAFRGSRLDLRPLSTELIAADYTVWLEAPLAVRRARIQHRGASAADAETLTPQAHRTLCGMHESRSDLHIHGHLVRLNTAELGQEEVVGRVIDAIGRGSGCTGPATVHLSTLRDASELPGSDDQKPPTER